MPGTPMARDLPERRTNRPEVATLGTSARLNGGSWAIASSEARRA